MAHPSKHSSAGQALIEAVLVLPVLLLMVLGGVDVIRLQSQWGTVQYVAQETSRCKALSGAACAGMGTQAYARQIAEGAQLPGSAALTASPGLCGTGCFKVNVDYPFTPLSPFIKRGLALHAVAQTTSGGS